MQSRASIHRMGLRSVWALAKGSVVHCSPGYGLKGMWWRLEAGVAWRGGGEGGEGGGRCWVMRGPKRFWIPVKVVDLSKTAVCIFTSQFACGVPWARLHDDVPNRFYCQGGRKSAGSLVKLSPDALTSKIWVTTSSRALTHLLR